MAKRMGERMSTERKPTGASRARTASLVTRIAAIALVVAAPFAPPLHRPGTGRSVMIVVDRSPSVGEAGREAAASFVRDAWASRGDARIGVVAFDGRPELWKPLEDDLADHADGVDMQLSFGAAAAPGSDVAAAVRLAAAALPDEGQRRIVLLSDGRATRGDALVEVSRAEERGITVDTVPLGTATPKTATLTRMSARETTISEGEPASLSFEIRGETNMKGKASVYRDGKLLREMPFDAGAGDRAELAFVDGHPEPGVHVYEARLPGADPISSAVLVGGKPRAIVIALDQQSPGVLHDALVQSEIQERVITVGEQRLDAQLLSSADLVVIADVPLAPPGSDAEAPGLTRDEQEALLDFAQKGGGVVVTGGAFGFAPEYAGSTLARMLPVEIEDQGQIEDPRVAMAIMLDRSGSMGAMVGNHNKLQLALEATLAAASTLRPDDSLAIGSVDTVTNWDEPLSPASALEPRKERIRKMEVGGGGIYVYTALVDAYAVLRHANAPVRHVILFADTADSEEQAQNCVYGDCEKAPNSAIELGEAAHKTGITTSVVGIGKTDDHDVPFLRHLAAAGGGRFYITGQATDLRRIFVSEARVATRSNMRDGPIDVDAADDHPILAGIQVDKLPPLGGFVETKRRATADLAIQARSDKRPVLASWRYGLGKAVAITSDLRGDWKGGWAAAADAGQLLRQTLRYAIRRHGTGAAEVRAAVHAGVGEITIDLPDSNEETKPPSVIEAFALDREGHGRAVDAPLVRVAPGRWTARAPLADETFLVARVRDSSGALVGETVAQDDAVTELANLGADERALRAMASEGGGEYDVAAETATRDGPRGAQTLPLTPWLYLAAALLVAGDVWLRRRDKQVRSLAAIGFVSALAAPIEGEAPRRAA